MQIHIARPDQNYGPYSLSEINTHLASGNLTASDLAWYEGSAGWIPVSQVPGVQLPTLNPPPPPPSTAPQQHPQSQPSISVVAPYQNASPEVERTIFEITPTISPDAAVCLFTCGLWLPVLVIRAIANQGCKFRLTNQRLIVATGLISRRVEEIELYRIKDVTFEQGVIGRIGGFGNVIVHGNDASTARIHLGNVNSPASIKEQIRDSSRASRRTEGVRSIEYGTSI